MTNKKYKRELEYLSGYDMTYEEKMKYIETLYRLAHTNFNNFIENDGQDLYQK